MMMMMMAAAAADDNSFLVLLGSHLESNRRNHEVPMEHYERRSLPTPRPWMLREIYLISSSPGSNVPPRSFQHSQLRSRKGALDE